MHGDIMDIIDTDISYYYTVKTEHGKEIYEAKPLNYFELLQLPRHFDAEKGKEHFRQLALAFHPDKAPGDKQKEEIFKKIFPAWETLKDETTREAYEHSLASTSSNNSASSAQTTPIQTYDDLDSYLQKWYGYYEELFANLSEQDDFESIYYALSENMRVTLVHVDHMREQHRLFKLLVRKASTGEQFYCIVLLQLKNPMDYGPSIGLALHNATNAGHIVAMLTRAYYNFLGFYKHSEQQIAWALECVRYVKTLTATKITHSTEQPVNSEAIPEYQELINLLQEIHQKIPKLPTVLPAKGTLEYNTLINVLHIHRMNGYHFFNVNMPVPDPIDILIQRYETGQAKRPGMKFLMSEPEAEKLTPTSTDDPTSQIRQGLQTYIDKIEKTYNRQLDYGFTFFKASQAQNRLANYLLAKELLHQLDAGTPIETLFSNKNELSQLRSQIMAGELFEDHGINSQDLNKVLDLGASMVKK